MRTAARLPQVLDHAPFKWEDTKKASLNARERLGPLQALQAEKIKEDAEDFGIRVAEGMAGVAEGLIDDESSEAATRRGRR